MGPTSTTPDLDSTGAGSGTSTGDATTTAPVPISGGSSSSGSEPSTGGGDASSTGPGVLGRVEDGLVVLYRLDEVDGLIVHDTAPVSPAIDLSLSGSGFTWVPGGLQFHGANDTIAASTTSTTKLNTACADSNEISLESWVTPNVVGTAGPPRIVTYSEDSSSRNFSLMVGSDVTGKLPPAVRGRFRTDAKVPNGTPSMVTELESSAKEQLAHIVYVRQSDGDEQMFVDGSLEAETTRAGDLSVWDTTEAMRLALGNEFIDSRPFDGTLHLVAVYCRALPLEDVEQNFVAGF